MVVVTAVVLAAVVADGGELYRNGELKYRVMFRTRLRSMYVED